MPDIYNGNHMSLLYYTIIISDFGFEIADLKNNPKSEIRNPQ